MKLGCSQLQARCLGVMQYFNCELSTCFAGTHVSSLLTDNLTSVSASTITAQCLRCSEEGLTAAGAASCGSCAFLPRRFPALLRLAAGAGAAAPPEAGAEAEGALASR